jgi:imidazolonepropionase-like amidohydrolase
MTGGHGWQFGVEADGPAEVAKAARKELKAGADVIKLMATGGICTEGVEPGQAQLGLDELKAAVDEAHKAGRKSAAHAQGLTGIKNALWAGIDSIEHGTYLDEEAVGLMLEKGVWLVPTLSAGDNMIRNGKEAGIPAFAVDKSMAHRKPRLKSLVLAHKAGVKIAMGTDAGTPCNKHGENARELCLMVDNGFTPQEALTAACHGAAEVLGLDAEIGSLEPGKRADLLIVNGSPLENIGLLTLPENILGVFKDGALAAGSWVKEVGKGS